MGAWNRSLMCLVLVALSLAGCSRKGHEQFIPTIESARDAVQEALQAWKEGKPCKAIDDVEPAIQPVESRWQQGKKLVSFEVLKELEEDGPKKFQVRIQLEGGKAEETIYIVLGKDPLFVYWLTDYEQSSKTM